jgi:SEC-C motif-containing protein
MISNQPCPCGSNKSYLDCCYKFINGEAIPKIALELMRSRYTAYTQANIDYIQKTMCGPAALSFNGQEAKAWAKSVKWLGLKIVGYKSGGPDDNQGTVNFIVRYRLTRGRAERLQENSKFERRNGKWFYIDRV